MNSASPTHHFALSVLLVAVSSCCVSSLTVGTLETHVRASGPTCSVPPCAEWANGLPDDSAEGRPFAFLQTGSGARVALRTQTQGGATEVYITIALLVGIALALVIAVSHSCKLSGDSGDAADDRLLQKRHQFPHPAGLGTASAANKGSRSNGQLESRSNLDVAAYGTPIFDYAYGSTRASLPAFSPSSAPLPRELPTKNSSYSTQCSRQSTAAMLRPPFLIDEQRSAEKPNPPPRKPTPVETSHFGNRSDPEDDLSNSWRRLHNLEPCSSASPAASMPQEQSLFPSMLVPHGQQFVCVIPDVLRRDRQQTSFTITGGRDGKPLFYVILNETSSSCAIWLKRADADVERMALIRTDAIHARCQSRADPMPEICFPSGDLFCKIERVGSAYGVSDAMGKRLMVVHGDFAAKHVCAIDPSGSYLCQTYMIGSDTDEMRYEVRVSPNVDAGFVLCALLAIDKAEAQRASR